MAAARLLAQTLCAHSSERPLLASKCHVVGTGAGSTAEPMAVDRDGRWLPVCMERLWWEGMAGALLVPALVDSMVLRMLYPWPVEFRGACVAVHEKRCTTRGGTHQH